MSLPMIEHRGIVQRLEGGRAVVAMETAGCSSCGHGSSCGIGKLASGRPTTLLTVPVQEDVKVGDRVGITLPERQLSWSACLGYLFPAFAMLLGAGFGAALGGSDGATALGAMLGFLGALVIARIAIGFLPGVFQAPRLIPSSSISQSAAYPQELHHEH